MKLDNKTKSLVKINNIVRQQFIEYQKENNKKSVFKNNELFISGNSNAYAESIAFPVFKVNYAKTVILTRVDEKDNLIGLYVVPIDAIKVKARWTAKTYVHYRDDRDLFGDKTQVYFLQIKYKDIEEYSDNILLERVNNQLQQL
jgi:hypothetical protein